MIAVDMGRISEDIAAVWKRFDELPRHIAKKHLLAAMRKSVKESGAVSRLRKNTPPLSTRRGRRAKGQKPVSTGDLRRSVTTKAKWIGNNKTGVAVAGIGYRYGWNSRKAIWKEYGTKWQDAVGMVERTFNEFKGDVASRLSRNMADAFEKGAAEMRSKMNPGYGN